VLVWTCFNVVGVFTYIGLRTTTIGERFDGFQRFTMCPIKKQDTYPA